MMANCPMNVPGTQISSAEAVNGETINFTTTGQVSELRRRVNASASMHNERHATLHGPMGDGMKEGGASMNGGVMGHDRAMDRIPPSKATVSELLQGASVTVTPNDPNDLQKLRSVVQMYVQQMQTNGCAMMGHASRE
jgi:hypothetical protein